MAQFRLGHIRDQLGESQDADRLYAEAATGYWELGSPSDRDLAALARTAQAKAAMSAGRDKEALTIMDQMVEQFGGFPAMESTSGGPTAALCMWLHLLAEANDPRLYEAAGVALGMIDPKNHLAFSTALGARAGSADVLGDKVNMVETYEKAIAWVEQEQPDLPMDAFLDRAVERVAGLLYDLGSDEEAAAAYKRVIERFEAKKTWRSRKVVAGAQARLHEVRNRARTGQR
jgi:tetratricopeptide (TPR) repeat protein